ncbi:hypothetical protein AJ78_05342 [Emergomyces pasteurianus Ep9510]|uniref:SPT2 chromatin protein n=1 Tax=Emergomyces pasteurianus Ep9510 TaxID=1447872 RepID=A0A1J9QGI4_9EURO|nr:hypothetical protein AJ78_05342 [Emergomyces pasteurianus Ep9510]
MSFLNSVLSSIETGDITSTVTPSTQNPISSSSKTSSTHSATAQSNPRSSIGLKRRTEDVRPAWKPHKISRSSSPQRSNSGKSTPAPSVATKPRSTSKPGEPTLATKPPSTSTPKHGGSPLVSPGKPPPKGSYAEMMLRAKALQEKTPLQLGMIKHHSIAKEKQLLQKRKAMEAKQKVAEEGKNKKTGTTTTAKLSNTNGQQTTKLSSARATLLKSRGEAEYKGTARPPSTPSVPEYKGTSGLPSRRASSQGRGRKKGSHVPRRDEYLATDEEDEGEFYDDYGEGEGYYSDESTDMEAGLIDVEEEEQRALRAAKLEDEKERLAEIAAKKEKMERKKRLDALANKSRR